MRHKAFIVTACVTWAVSLHVGVLCGQDRQDNAAHGRFQAVHELLVGHVQRQQIAGAVGLVIERGRVVYSEAVGFRDVESAAPMTPDTIFRIASMSKPITSVAVMILREQGKLDLSDPLSKYVPEFQSPQVLRDEEDGRTTTVPAEREITIRDLLTHTSGITYGFFGGAHQGLYKDAGVTSGLIESDLSLADNVRRLAGVPLAHQPGQAWQYGLSTDVLGRVVEVVSGQSLGEFFRQHIFEPLGMRDTCFHLPAAKVERLATLYRPDEVGRIQRVGDGPQSVGGVDYSATFPLAGRSTYESGGGGLVSTAHDYARLLRMFAGNGELDGARLLSPDTVAEMTRNQIGDLDILFTIHGNKFGYGFGVHTEESPDRHGSSIGTYSWGGIFHTYFWVDPRRDVIGLVMTQLFPFDHLTLWADYQEDVYKALDASVDTPLCEGPQPGDVYRESATHNGGPRNWRVTDPNALAEGAAQFLPNPVLTIPIDDLEGAVRAEVLIDRWGGHPGTTNKRIRFNGNAWLLLPEPTTPPAGRAEQFYSQDNPIVEVPLAHLKEGVNTFEGICGALAGERWGQYGLYSAIVRVYYDPDHKPHPTGRIVTPRPGEIVGEIPTITLQCSSGTTRADVIAWYEGYDENGDGVFLDWHKCYHQPLRGEPADLAGHVGTVRQPPYQLTWDTQWVPDQQVGAVKLVARVQDAQGVWSVTDIVDGLTLKREGSRVAMYRAVDVPEEFGVRVDQKASCTIPIAKDAPLDRVARAALPLRTWHGDDAVHHPLRLNDHRFAIRGNNHHYDFDWLPLASNALRRGDNLFAIESETEHHMLEILWPGPALIVRYSD